MSSRMSRDEFGNPIYGSVVNDGESLAQSVRTFLTDNAFGGVAEYGDGFCDALYERWRNYGIQLPREFSSDDAIAFDEVNEWMTENLLFHVRALWRRYQPIVEAYKTKVDWASGIINTTTYKDVKDTSVNNGESTDWALPNKKVESPYGTPTSHSENNGGNTNTKTGSVETKGMLNPVTQRDLYARLIRDAYGDMAEECAPVFNQMHL